ncbi:MAG: ATP-binding protein, partial [Chlorobiales bacterium]|nr:ATP-binding protein [Chlorobiales bacterium]
MSHELRTPLNAIIGFSEILADQTFGPMNAKQLKQVKHISAGGRHLLQLINDILDLAKVEAGKMELQPTAVNLHNLLENSLFMIKEKAIKHGLELELRVAEELRLREIHADELKLKQIVFNLLSNAAKFTPDGGKIEIEAWIEGNEVRIKVSDTGIGVDPKDQTRIFESFEQVDASYARQQTGTGLGLDLTRQLVQLHGGGIWVESEGKGKGSTFIVALPIVQCEDRSDDSACTGDGERDATPMFAPTEVADSAPIVLVVEDDPSSNDLISLYLHEAGYAVTQVFDGDRVMEPIKKQQPFAVILDVLLPKRSGFEVLLELKADPNTRDIPVLIVTGADEREIGFALGATEFLTKPLEKTVLVRALDRLRVHRKLT